VIGVGIVTYNRPAFFSQVINSVREHLSDVVDHFVVYNDASDEKHKSDYVQAYSQLPQAKILHETVNKGVAAAKNACLRDLLDRGCDWLFILEDDILIQDEKAVTGYIKACRETGVQHLNFHAHGDGNKTPFGGAIGIHGDYPVTCWTHFVGAWCFYTRESLEKCGLFDEGFINGCEHIEHTMRLAEAKFTTPFPFVADATGSENWLKEIENSIALSSIRVRDDFVHNVVKSREHWQKAHPSTYAVRFENMPPWSCAENCKYCKLDMKTG
jgi:GT2 family glycosyltransferase